MKKFLQQLKKLLIQNCLNNNTTNNSHNCKGCEVYNGNGLLLHEHWLVDVHSTAKKKAKRKLRFLFIGRNIHFFYLSVQELLAEMRERTLKRIVVKKTSLPRHTTKLFFKHFQLDFGCWLACCWWWNEISHIFMK